MRADTLCQYPSGGRGCFVVTVGDTRQCPTLGERVRVRFLDDPEASEVGRDELKPIGVLPGAGAYVEASEREAFDRGVRVGMREERWRDVP